MPVTTVVSLYRYHESEVTSERVTNADVGPGAFSLTCESITTPHPSRTHSSDSFKRRTAHQQEEKEVVEEDKEEEKEEKDKEGSGCTGTAGRNSGTATWVPACSEAPEGARYSSRGCGAPTPTPVHPLRSRPLPRAGSTRTHRSRCIAVMAWATAHAPCSSRGWKGVS